MAKKDKDSVLDDYEKLKNEMIFEKVNRIFHNNPKDYIARLEEIGFEYHEEEDYEELEEKNTKPENQNQRNLVAYFANKKKLSEEIFNNIFT